MANQPAAPEVPDAGAFLSQVTHNLRSPIASARTILSVLSQGYVGRMDDQQAELVRRVERRIICLQMLVDDLIELASIRTGMFSAGGPTALDAVVREVCARLAPAARTKGVEIVLAASTTPVLVSASPGLLDPLVTQLLRNALTYTISGSVRVSIEPGARLARLVVADSGIGIPADDRARVFEEFFRADNAKSLDELGTGLGLPIVRAVACRTGATIELESTEGKGTTIAVLLPRGGNS
jgi:signal transduction histidine kinase